MNAKKPGATDYLLLGGLALIFGFSFILTNVAVQSVAPISVATSRLLLASVVLFPLMRFYGQHLPGRGRVWLFIVAAAMFGYAIPFALISWGQVKVDAGLTAILMAVMPLMTVLLAHVTTRDEKMNRYKFIGVLCGLLGVVVLIGWDKLGQLGDSMLRQYAIALAALCYAINAIITKRLTDIPRLSMVCALLLVATILLLPFAIGIEQPWNATIEANSIVAIIVLALGPTALATLILLSIVARQGASFLSQINFLLPLCGVLMAYLFLDETLPTSAWVALCIIMVGIGLSRMGDVLRAS